MKNGVEGQWDRVQSGRKSAGLARARDELEFTTLHSCSKTP